MGTQRHLFTRPRVIIVGGMIGIPDLLLFGRYNNNTAQPMIAPHRLNPNDLLICYLVKGRQLYRVGAKDYLLQGGEVLVVFPNEVYSTAETPQEKGILYWLHLRIPAPTETFLDLPPDQAGPLVRALRQIRPQHFPGSYELKHLCDEIYLTYHRPWSPLRKTRLTNRLIAFLFQLIDSARQRSGGDVTHRLRNVVAYIEEHLTAPLSVPMLARQTGLSVSRFKTQFKEATGLPPGEYVLRAKIEEAKRQLSHGQTTVTATAFGLGFTSSQYFATVFKRYTGQRPSALGKKAGHGH
ncbi:MAG: HTH-type transcriptional activator RhaS [Verrucomicrobiae bacterium]|nr:HTH-type transcriptional activator RhaS [Verrucomicrobiae bacterium]